MHPGRTWAPVAIHQAQAARLQVLLRAALLQARVVLQVQAVARLQVLAVLPAQAAAPPATPVQVVVQVTTTHSWAPAGISTQSGLRKRLTSQTVH